MLPTFNLQFGEITHFDTDVNSAPLLPEDSTELNGSFADLLHLRLDVTVDEELDSGQVLPPDGNALPPVSLIDAEFARLLDPDDAGSALPGEVDLRQSLVVRRSDLRIEDSIRIDIVSEVDPDPGKWLPKDAAGSPVFVVPTAAPGMLVENPHIRITQADIRPGDRSNRSLIDDSGNPATSLRSMPESSAGSEAESRRDLMQGAETLPLKETSAASLSQTEPALHRVADTPARGELPQLDDSLPTSQVQQLAPLSIRPQLTPANPVPGTIEIPVQDKGWGEHFGKRILLLASNRLQSAEIRLTPAELGPLRVQISVDDGSASVTFHAQHVVTREAIEQALPRLRELLAESGIELGQTSVGEQGVQHDHRDADAEPVFTPTGPEGNDVSPDDISPQSRMAVASDGLVDTFA